MKIRIMGTEENTAQFIEKLRSCFDLISVSGFYPNRNAKESREGRVYIEVLEGRE